MHATLFFNPFTVALAVAAVVFFFAKRQGKDEGTRTAVAWVGLAIGFLGSIMVLDLWDESAPVRTIAGSVLLITLLVSSLTLLRSREERLQKTMIATAGALYLSTFLVVMVVLSPSRVLSFDRGTKLVDVNGVVVATFDKVCDNLVWRWDPRLKGTTVKLPGD